LTAALKIAVAGLGTVGAEVVRLIERQAEVLRQRCGRPLEITAVSARDRKRDRGFDPKGLRWYDDAVAMARESDAEIVVELIGGEDGVARRVCEAAIEAGRAVVTANKALLARRGTELARRAESAGVALNFEAAVAGGIPIVKALREGLAANRFERIYGILNGTCNYILTEMQATGRSFDAVLRDAQKLGYAEADPSFDVDGIDTAHKLAILTSLAYGCEVDFAGVHIEGIRQVTAHDIAFADELGYRIKLLGIARRTGHGIEQRVHPCMVPVAAPIAHIAGAFNAVVAEGDFVGSTMFEGRGAGAGPTASAVVADLIDIARGSRVPTFAVPAAELAPARSAPMAEHSGAYYVRLMVVDRPGVMADVTAALRDELVSMEALIQRSRAPGEPVPVVMTTHETGEAPMLRALARIAALNTVVERPCMIRIEPLTK
jgi:homoserine dehydrogenase